MLNEPSSYPKAVSGLYRSITETHPYTVTIDAVDYTIQYDPGDSTSDFFGGNSNWRGPVWMPINYLLIQSLKKFGEFYGETVKLEYPTDRQRINTF
jgi:hypothetical protein